MDRRGHSIIFTRYAKLKVVTFKQIGTVLTTYTENTLYGMQLGASSYIPLAEHPLKAMSDTSDAFMNSFAGSSDPAYLMLGLGGDWN